MRSPAVMLAQYFAVGFLLCCGALASAQSAIIQSGLFEGLMLAVDREGIILGYFRQDQGERPSKTCSFYLAGKAGPGEVRVLTWNRESYPGTLKMQKHGVTLAVPNGDEHPGCGLVLPPQIAHGLQLDRTSEAHWTELRNITARRAYFHSAPDPSKRLRSFGVAGDVVGVRSTHGEWLQVDYVGGSKPAASWIRSHTTDKIAPPKWP